MKVKSENLWKNLIGMIGKKKKKKNPLREEVTTEIER